MAEHDDASKTEEPTSRKLLKGRERGQVAVSQEAKSWAMLFAGALALVFLAPEVMREVAGTGRVFLEQADAFRLDAGKMQTALAELILTLAWQLAPVVGLLIVVAFAASVLQTGLLWAPTKIRPELSKISLAKGAKRMFSVRSFVEFLKGVVKLSAVSAVAFGLALPLTRDLALVPAMSLGAVLHRLDLLSIRLAGGAAAVMAAVAIADYLYQRHAFFKQMRMTKQEVKDEHKQSEGDPQIKSRIRKLRMERAQRRMMAAVPEADVVITNPTHYAVALRYRMEEMSAPKVVAKGADLIARRIRDVAEEHDVPLIENPPLARALYASVELDEEIPAEHYQAVAEVIGYVMRLKGRL